MTLKYCHNYQKVSETAADWLAERIRGNPNLKLGIATGNSPLAMYRNIAERGDLDTTQVSIFQVDEWAEISEYSNTCRSYIEKEICEPWEINPNNCFLFTKDVSAVLSKLEAQQATVTMQQTLDKLGPLDVLILGFGKNGHIGFIEPSDSWAPETCFVSQLEDATQSHSMVASEKSPAKMGVTIGLKTVRTAKEILFIVTGDQKLESFRKWLTKELSPQIPASILWQHPNVFTVTDLAKGKHF
ncbi:MAG TPA: 6-phosphogluconolactonase [Flavobacteriaceae bacterium]|nr:6-phosphogluconolactonase [Flavobacteriaceae bacterium]